MDAEIDAVLERPNATGAAQVRLALSAYAPRTALMGDSQAIAVFAALGHQVRLNLWRLLLPYGEAGLSAGLLASRMSILPSSLSFHLRLMTQAGVLIQRRSSRHIIYAVNVGVIEALGQLFMSLSPSDTTASSD